MPGHGSSLEPARKGVATRWSAQVLALSFVLRGLIAAGSLFSVPGSTPKSSVRSFGQDAAKLAALVRSKSPAQVAEILQHMDLQRALASPDPQVIRSCELDSR